MAQLLERILNKYGTSMEVYRNGQWEALRGFLQPTLTRSRTRIPREVTPLGEVPEGMYLFIGPAAAKVDADDLLKRDGVCFILRQVDTVYYQDMPAYCWGLCVRKGEEDAWGS